MNSELIRLGMLNWTNDIPTGSQNIFLNILEMLRPISSPKILEIGTYTGVSIMTIKKLFPKSICYAIDNWKLNDDELQMCQQIANISSLTMEDVRNTFLLNTQNQVNLIENNSFNALIDLYKENAKFDFIYVDGSHTILDTYVDLVLSWSLLEKNGILGIDDYYLTFFDGSRPREAIDSFLTKFQEEYVILYKGCRVFLQKK